MGSKGVLVIVSVDGVDGVGVREKARGVVPVAVRGSDFASVSLVFGVATLLLWCQSVRLTVVGSRWSDGAIQTGVRVWAGVGAGVGDGVGSCRCVDNLLVREQK